jgi:hypothetical protein
MSRGPLFGIDCQPPPKKCPDCRAKLAQPQYVKYHDRRYGKSCERWQIECACGVILVWSFPQRWVRKHVLPLWEAMKTVCDY